MSGQGRNSMAQQIFKNPLEQSNNLTLNLPSKPVSQKMLDGEIKSLFKNRQEGLDYINTNFEDGEDKTNALNRLDRVYPSTRSKWNRYFKHIGDGNPRTVDKYNRLLEEIESELPFENEDQHKKWLDLGSAWMGESEWPDMTKQLLYKQENPPKDLVLDRKKYQSVYDKAKADFPNDWANRMDYIKQEMGLDYPESISDLMLKGNKLYGLQTEEEDEPYEVELYNLK